MQHYAGIDVSLELSSVCVVDTQGKIVKEAQGLNYHWYVDTALSSGTGGHA
jgi:hypothetical protein